MVLQMGGFWRFARALLWIAALCVATCSDAQVAVAPDGARRVRDALALGAQVAEPAHRDATGEATAGGTMRWLAVQSGSLRLSGANGAGLLLMAQRRAVRVASALPEDRLDAVIARAARRFGHDRHLIKAMIHVESNFNAAAVSHKGAIGLMQVMPATGERLGVDDPGSQLFDVETNVHAGAKYLRLLMDLFPNELHLAIAAYNAGEGAVLRHGRRIPPFRETQAYVQRVLAQYEIYGGQ